MCGTVKSSFIVPILGTEVAVILPSAILPLAFLCIHIRSSTVSMFRCGQSIEVCPNSRHTLQTKLLHGGVSFLHSHGTCNGV